MKHSFARLSTLFVLLTSPLANFAFADALKHADEDTFAAEAQQLAPAVLAPPAPAVTAENIVQGVWSAAIPWTPHIPVTAAQLPDGRLLTFASNQRTTFPSGVEFTYAATWNPATGQFVEYNHPSHDMFCAGVVMLPDGRVLVNGGRNETVRASIFDWRTNQWTRIQDMNGGRWYNASVALPDGQVFTATGSGTGTNTVERWNATTGWNVLTGIPWVSILGEAGYATQWHPFLTLTPDGRIFHFGPTDIMHWITWSGSGTITNSGNTVLGTHYPKEGCSAVYDEGKILVAGGAPNTTAGGDGTSNATSSNLAYTVNVNTTLPTIAQAAPMANARQFANSVILPNGEVMVIGGNTSGLKFNDTGSIFACEIWNPSTGSWRTVASTSVPRNYHSLAVLLPDGRVLSGGGGLGGNAADHRDAQLFTPPMLYNADGSLATRPVISAVPAQVGVGGAFSVIASPGLSKFAFIKMSAVTHSVNTDLRYLSLPFSETSSGNYVVTARNNLNSMTPGYWMLFGILPSGVYSEAKIIQVDPTGAVSLANPGNQTSIVATTASLQLVSSGPVGVSRIYSVTGLPPGLSISPGGLISGALAALGTYNVRATVTGGTSSSFQDFTWTVVPATVVQNFDAFANSAGFTLNGSAAVTTGVLRLTPSTNSQTGSAFLTSPFAIGPNTSFVSRFVFRQHGTADGADGLTFSIQGLGPATIGVGGGGLGLGGVTKSVSMEVDSYQGTGDPSANHLGIILNGDFTSHVQSYTPAFDMENAASHTVWAEYDGPANTLRVYLAQGIVTTRPAAPVMSATNLDLPAITSGTAWFGFSAATGGANNNHDIEAWNLTVNANALPALPVVANPGNQNAIVGSAASLQIVASDINGDLLSYSATGLPAGLLIGANNGLISGVPTSVGVTNVVVSVSDGFNAPVAVSYTWTVKNPLTVLALTGAPLLNGTTATFTGQVTGGLNPEYKWSFGDGTLETAWSSFPSASHAYPNPGRYLVTLTVRDATGAEVTTSFHQAIHAPLTTLKPARSSSIVFEDRATGNDRVWCVNADNNSVSVFDSVTRARLAETTVGNAPRSLAIAPDGRVWVANSGASSISILNPVTFAVVQTVALPRSSRPFGLAFDPDGTDAWVACEDSGQLLRLNPASGAQIGSVAVGLNVRHVAINADSSRVFVTRFISPPLPGEATATPLTEIAGTKYGGEIVVINPASATIDRTVILQHSEAPDTDVSAKGIPNYVGVVAISPDGLSAWVPSKQDNVKRGQFRNGQLLTHDMAVRSIVSRLFLSSGIPLTDDLASRVDFDNAGIPSTSAFDSRGIYVFTALEGSRAVSVTDAWTRQELFRFDTGRAPQGLALSPDGRTLYVQNFMDRTITVHDIGLLIDGAEVVPPATATLNCVATDLLSPTVLRGKQFFYDAKDGKLALEEYISCAACHNDGGQDGRVWDFTQFGEGLRNTIVLRGHGGMAQGPLHWSGNFDEIQDFEGQIRAFSGGLGLMSDVDFHAGTRSQPLGDSKAGRSVDLDALAAYVSSLTQAGGSPLRNADGSLTAAALAGESVFRQQNCAGCHSGTNFSDSAIGVFRNVGTLKPSSGKRLGIALAGLDTPTLRGVWSTGPYLHDGSAVSISDAIAAHTGVNLLSGDLANLAAYVRQIDDAITTAPIDGSSPMLVLSGPTAAVSGQFNVTATFSEPITGLTASDFTVTNGTASTLTGGGSSYTLAITPASAGSVSIILPAGKCFDASANGNVASNTFNVTFTPSVTTVNGLSGDYYVGENFETFAFSRVDPTVNFNWPFESLAQGFPADHFSIRWTGKVLPVTTGNHTFITSADDGVRLWVNGQLLIDNWENQGTIERQGSIALTAGVPADIRIEYFDAEWGAVIKLEWQASGLGRQIIPSGRLSAGNGRPVPTLGTSSTSVSDPFDVNVTLGETVTGLSASDFVVGNGAVSGFVGSGASYVLTIAPGVPGPISVNLPAGTCNDADGQGNLGSNTLGLTYTPGAGAVVHGLSGDYYNGRNFERYVLTRVDSAINFSWPFEAPAPGLPQDLFSVRWTGKVIPLYSETYIFTTTTDDGVRLWVNDQLIVDQWVDQGATSHQGTLVLTAGVPADIRLEYFDNAWGAVARLEWQSATQLRQIVPTGQLSAGSGRPVPMLATASASVSGSFVVTIGFSESVTGLTASDFVISNGVAGNFSGSGASYSLIVNPAANGEVTVNLPANACSDLSAEKNVAANTLGVTYTPLAGATLAGLKGEYFAGKTFAAPLMTRIDQAINFVWYGAPDVLVPADLFAVRWTGKITAAYTEIYTFTTSTDDGVRLWVNNQLLIDQWQDQGVTAYQGSIALSAGVPMDIRMEFYDNEWGAVAQLEWASTSQARQIVPRDRLSTIAPPSPPPPGNLAAARLLAPGGTNQGTVASAKDLLNSTRPTSQGSVRDQRHPTSRGNFVSPRHGSALFPGSGLEHGLIGEYFSGSRFGDFVAVRTDAQIDFFWPEGFAAFARLPNEGYSVRWRGRIRPMFSEAYHFFLAVDDGARLWVNNQLVLDHWAGGLLFDAESKADPIFLHAGEFYDVRIEYQNLSGDGRVELRWESVSQPHEIVPASRLFRPSTDIPRKP